MYAEEDPESIPLSGEEAVLLMGRQDFERGRRGCWAKARIIHDDSLRSPHCNSSAMGRLATGESNESTADALMNNAGLRDLDKASRCPI